MARDDEDEVFEEEFSLDGGTEEDNDGDSDFSEAEGDGDGSDEGDAVAVSEDDDSDFESSTAAKPKAKPRATPRRSPASSTDGRAKGAAGAKRARPSTTASTRGPSPVKKKAAVAQAAGNKAKAAATPPPVKGDPTAHVLDYMRKTNRPYSLLNVFENLHKAIAKPALTRILDNLVDSGELVSKTYGKAKIYCMNQAQLPVPSPEEQQVLEDQIQQVTAESSALELELKATEATLAGIHAQISDADLDATLAQLEKESAELEAKLARLQRSDREPASPGRKDALKRKFALFQTAWVKRKRIVTDAVNQIADGMEKKPSAVYELVGIETDADAGVTAIPTL